MSQTGKRTGMSPWRIVGVVLVAAISLGASAIGTATQQTSQPRTVIAEFKNASPLLPGNDVKVNGVKVGQVSAIYVSGHHANVSFTVSPEAQPLHVDARASVRPVSLLGERYVDFDRGTPSAPLLRGDIPLSRTSQNTDLDQVLNVLDDRTGEPLAALITVLGQGMQGNGRNIANTIKALGPAMTDTQGLMKILNKQNGTLNDLVDNVQPVAKSLARDGGRTLDGLVDSAHQVLGTTSANQRALQATIASLPATLAQARSTFQQLTGTARAATPTLRAIRPTTDNLNTISRELRGFSDAADPALAKAQPVLDKAQALLDRAQPVTRELRESGPSMRSVAGSARPLVDKLAGNFNNVMNFIRGWALATNGKDGLGHYFRAMTIITPKIATGLLPGGLPGGNAGAGHPPAVGGGKPGPGTPQNLLGPLLGNQGGAAPGQSGLLARKTSFGGGVTGLTEGQESGALGFLLGGNGS